MELCKHILHKFPIFDFNREVYNVEYGMLFNNLLAKEGII